MRVSAKTEYACIAMLELAASYGTGQPVRIGKIAERHGIPSRFLVQILLQLKGAGLVNSTRGAAGGYQLLLPPDEITIGTVMSVIDGQPPHLTSSVDGSSPTAGVLMELWQQIADVEREMLESVTFADLVERAKEQDENMYYI